MYNVKARGDVRDLPVLLFIYFLRPDLSMSSGSLTLLGWLVSELQVSICLPLSTYPVPSTAVKDATAPGFHMPAGNPNSCSHTCTMETAEGAMSSMLLAFISLPESSFLCT